MKKSVIIRIQINSENESHLQSAIDRQIFNKSTTLYNVHRYLC